MRLCDAGRPEGDVPRSEGRGNHLLPRRCGMFRTAGGNRRGMRPQSCRQQIDHKGQGDHRRTLGKRLDIGRDRARRRDKSHQAVGWFPPDVRPIRDGLSVRSSAFGGGCKTQIDRPPDCGDRSTGRLPRSGEFHTSLSAALWRYSTSLSKPFHGRPRRWADARFTGIGLSLIRVSIVVSIQRRSRQIFMTFDAG